jgi:phenylpropionate dioxygenase-like ring-hydroxylating dioxygenase large terminal subunit
LPAVSIRLSGQVHGWTYALDGQLRGTPEFAAVCDFDRAANGLVAIASAVW